jgi:hypothetical protein
VVATHANRLTCLQKRQQLQRVLQQTGPTRRKRYLAGELGFEPRLAESESAVLPLDDSPTKSLIFRRFLAEVLQPEAEFYK